MNRKEAVLKSVLKLVNREGFYHLNMKSIAQEANVAAGTIYVHFKGKAELINALYLMIVNDFKEQVLNGYTEGRAFKENFFEMFHNAVDFYISDPDCFSFIEQYTYAPFIFKETQEENFVMMEPIYKIIREAKKQKLVRDLPQELLVSLIYGPIVMMMKLHLAHKVDLGNKQTKQKLIQSCWDSIAAVK